MARILTILILLAAFAFAARTTYETNNDNFVCDLPTEDTLNGGALGYLRIMAWDNYISMIEWNLASLPTGPISSCSLKVKVMGASSSTNITTKSFQISSLVDTMYGGNGNFTAYVTNASCYKYKQYNSVYWLGNASNRVVDICKGNNNSRINSVYLTNMTITDEVRSIPLDLAIMQDMVNKTAYGLAIVDTSNVAGNYYLRSLNQANDTHPALIINTYTLNNPTSSPCSLVFSVGTSTNDFKTSSPTISISSGTATFSIAQTNDSMGVGDEVTFGTGAKVYLMRKSSTTQWRVTSPAGKWPDGVSGEPVLSIKRAFNSLNAAVSGSAPGAANASHLNSMALTTTDTRLYIACYADGVDASMDTVRSTWTTDATRYITIFTPTNTSTECNTNQRHNGVINGGGYTLQSSFAGDYARNIDIGANYTKVIGLKIIRTSSNWSYGSCIGSYTTAGAGNNCEFAYNLLYQQSGGDYGCLIYNGNISTSDHYACSIHDNILVSGSSTLLWGIYYDGNYQTTAARQSKIYNNTVYGSYTSSGGAIRIVVNNSASSSYLPLVKNNYAANTGTGSDYIFGGADYSNANAEFAYNGSDDGTAGTSNANQTISAANMYFTSTTGGSEDLHIKSWSYAILGGVGPSSDANVSSFDIDGNTRTGTQTDMGADNTPYTLTAAADPCTLYYSVGTSTNDFKTSSPTISVSAGIATFSTGQTSTSMGVGDMITIGTNYTLYLKKKNSSTEWVVCDPRGRTPSNMSALTVTSIKRAFNSLNAALNGTSPGVCDATHANLSGTPISLVTAGKLIFVPCYADGNDDGGTVNINAFGLYPTKGCDATHFVKVFTPTNTSTECNQSQRHSGTTARGYKLNISTASADGINIVSSTDYLRIEGLIIQGPGATSTGQGIQTDIVSCLIKNCIITGFQHGQYNGRTMTPGLFIENSIIYDCNTYGIYGGQVSQSGTVYILNSTIIACGIGAYATNIDHNYVIRNSIFQNNTTDIGGTSADIFVYRSILETNPAAFAGADSENVRSTTLEFLDSTNNNWQLNINDAPAIDIGTDLSGIATYPFSDDIAGTTRPTNGSWDIGASEMPYTLAAYGSDPSPVYFSVGTSTTDKKGSATTIVVTAGAATITGLAGTENIGVGDKIYFGATKNSVYIRGKTDATHWDVSTGNGKKPTISSTSCDSIKRAFNSLNAALNGSSPGAGNSAHLNAMDLVTNKEKLFIPCYADGDDASLTTLDTSWVTSATYYITIFTPTSISTECNTSQRHNGIANGGGYTLNGTDGTTYRWTLAVGARYTKVLGIKIKRNSSNWNYGYAIGENYDAFSGTSTYPGIYSEIAYNLLIQESGGDYGSLIGWTQIGAAPGYGVSVHDNICISRSATLNFGLVFDANYQTTEARQCKIYNNTFYGAADSAGIQISVDNSASSSYLPFMKNNYSVNTATGVDYSFHGPDYSNTTANFAYNGSDDGTAGTSNNNQTITVANMAFTSTTGGSEDLHIGRNSTANNMGIGPTSDANTPTPDLDGNTRSGATADIGADEQPLDPDAGIVLAEHAAGQVSDAFNQAGKQVDTVLFRFKITPTGSPTVDRIAFRLWNVFNLIPQDFSNVKIYQDTDNNGIHDAGEVTAVGGTATTEISSGTGRIYFTTDIVPSVATNYLLVADLQSLYHNDSLRIGLYTDSITLLVGPKSGTVTDIAHKEVYTTVPNRYESVSNRANYTTGTISTTAGSKVVTGSGTAWTTDNRGQGDSIYIAACGKGYIIDSVTSETRLVLVRNANSTNAGAAYTILRKYSTFANWENQNRNIVTDNWSEVAVLFNDGAEFTSQAIVGWTMDASHPITITVNPANRHTGRAGTGVG